MTYVVYRPNLLDRNKDSLSFVGSCRTLRDALVARFGSSDFEAPTYVEVDGIPWLRKQWDDLLPAGASVTVNVVPAAVAPAVLTAVTVASLLLSAYVAYRVSQLPSLADAVGAAVPEKAPVFTFEGQKNIQRLNNVVDVVYGRLRWWPAYLCAPYVDYANNKPTLHLWLSLGKGNYAIEDVRVNDTSLSGIGKAVFEQHDSGYAISGADDYDLVYYAEDFSGTELTGTNEEEHAVLGPYMLNPANTTIEVVKVNFAYTSGLYAINSSGSVVSASCATSVTLTEVDDRGVPTGGFQSFAFTHTKAATTPLRITETMIPTDPSFTGTGRYTISAVRTNAKNTSTNGQDQCTVESAFALGHSGRTFPSSLLYVRLPGTNVVGQDAAEKINVVATRKLRARVDGAWTSELPTRNPVWAILDILQQAFGAGLPDTSLDLAYWEEMAEELSSFNFDYRFEQKTTVWDAITAVATVFRGKPYWVGSDVRLSVDSPVRTPVCVFTPDSAKDLHLKMSFKTSTENDCIEAAYVDPETGLQDSVYFTPPGSLAVNPTKVTFAGVTDRETAWRLAAYTYLQRTLLRDTVTLSTGLDGKIPMLGEVILVSWPLPSWSSAGIVLSSDNEARLELSEDVPYTEGWISLRFNNGSSWGPVRYTKEVDPSSAGKPVVALEYAPDASLDFTAIDHDPVAYTIGQADVMTRRFQVTSASPSGDSVQVEAIEFDPAVFSYDNLTVPARGDDMLPYPSTSGPVPWVRVLEESGQYFRVEIGPVYGSPQSVTCKYTYVAAASVTKEMLAAPWLYIGELRDIPVATATEYGPSYYVPRQDAYLFVRIDVTMAGGFPVYQTWWRAYPKSFGSASPETTHVYVVNNCDAVYAGPGSPSNVAGGAAQGTALDVTPGLAKLDTNEGRIVATTDAPPSTGAAIMVYKDVGGTITASITKVLLDVGPVSFSADELVSAGIQGTESTYPDVYVASLRTGDGSVADRTCAVAKLNPQPLVSTVVGQTVSYEYTGKSLYLEGTAYWYQTLDYHDYATAFVHLYAVRLVNGYSGAYKYKYSICGQTATTNYDGNLIRTEYTTEPYLLLPRFLCAHMDTPVFGATGSLTGKMRLGNRYWTTYNEEYVWFCVALDANFTPVLDLPLIMGNQASTKMKQSNYDNVDNYELRAVPDTGNPSGIRALTAGEWSILSESAVYFVFTGAGSSPYSLPSISPTGWGRVKIAMVDMFGKLGNETTWTAVGVP